jgi:hypothetical protein
VPDNRAVKIAEAAAAPGRHPAFPAAVADDAKARLARKKQSLLQRLAALERDEEELYSVVK